MMHGVKRVCMCVWKSFVTSACDQVCAMKQLMDSIVYQL